MARQEGVGGAARRERRGPQLPLFPVLLAATAVLAWYARNVRYVQVTDMLPVLTLAILGSALAFLIVALALRDIGRAALVSGALVMCLLWFGYVGAFVGPHLPLHAVFLLVVLFVTTVGVLVTSRLARFVRPLNFALTVILAVLLGMQLATIGAYYTQPPVRVSAPVLAPSDSSSTTQRDIYYLIFDRYGSNAALNAAFGVTDNDLPDWLADQGFAVARDSHANYVRTTLSMASVLNLDYLQNLFAADPESTDHRHLHDLLEDHAVGRFLQSQGYSYIHVGSWYGPTRTSRIADQNLEPDSPSEFRTVLLNESAAGAINELLGRGAPEDWGHQVHADTARFQFRTLHELVDQSGPKFVLAHVLLPHDPYVFDASGDVVPPSQRGDTSEEEQFETQLRYTNVEIRQLVQRLLDRPETEQPIIVIQADEGPYPTRMREDPANFSWSTASWSEIKAKYGILNALYLPRDPGSLDGRSVIYPTMSSVNTFRAVLGHYFGLDLPLLTDRSYTSSSADVVFDFADITGRLQQP